MIERSVVQPNRIEVIAEPRRERRSPAGRLRYMRIVSTSMGVVLVDTIVRLFEETMCPHKKWRIVIEPVEDEE